MTIDYKKKSNFKGIKIAMIGAGVAFLGFLLFLIGANSVGVSLFWVGGLIVALGVILNLVILYKNGSLW